MKSKKKKIKEDYEDPEDLGTDRDEPESEEEWLTGPGKPHGERFFGPGTKQDWNRINDPDYRYPVRFPPGWSDRTKWRPDDGWVPGSFFDDFFYWMETYKYSKASADYVVSRHLFNRLKKAQGAEGYFGQGGNFSDLPRMQKQPLSPSDEFTKNYLKFWVNEPWWRVFWYDQLTEDEAVHDRGNEWFEIYRDLKETPALYQKWVERREVREDKPIPSLPIGPPPKVFKRKLRQRRYSSPMYLRLIELLADDDEAIKKGWTMKELVRQTIRRNKVLAKECTPKFVRSDLNKLVWTYKVTCSGEGSDPGGHLCRIRILPKYKGVNQSPEDIMGEDFGDLHVGVKCTCPAFKFWGPSYNSWSLGYNYGSREDDGSPATTNVRHKLPLDGSTRRALLCKHLIAAAQDDWMDRVLTEE